MSSTKELSKKAKLGDKNAQKLLERSASLIACQIAGIYKFKNLKFQISNLKLIMDGSLILKGFNYQNYYIRKYLKLLNLDINKINFIK